jgi:hypothetical protein
VSAPDLSGIYDLRAYALGYSRSALDNAAKMIERGVPADVVCAHITDAQCVLEDIANETVRREKVSP